MTPATMSDRPSSVVTIGNFDGVHLGHAALLRRARELADADGFAARVVALAFDPHPAAALAPGSAPATLTGFAERRRLLLEAGADDVKRLTPTPELLSLDPSAFLDRVCSEWNVVGIVEGHDFHFGKGRAGTPRVLRAYGEARGVRVEIVKPVLVDLCDQTLVRASSTVVRWLLGHGRVTDAHRILGRPHAVSGVVVRNDQRGRTIGFPTANLDPATLGDSLLPSDGVYAALARLPGAALTYPAAVHIGPRATFAAPRRVVEAHVIGWPGPSPGTGVEQEYGWELRLELLAHLRAPLKFDGIKAIRAQLTSDVARAGEIADMYRAGATPDAVCAGRG